MTRFEKLMKEMTVEEYLRIEAEMLECWDCYCFEECRVDKTKRSCAEIRKAWMLKDIT